MAFESPQTNVPHLNANHMKIKQKPVPIVRLSKAMPILIFTIFKSPENKIKNIQTARKSIGRNLKRNSYQFTSILSNKKFFFMITFIFLAVNWKMSRILKYNIYFDFNCIDFSAKNDDILPEKLEIVTICNITRDFISPIWRPDKCGFLHSISANFFLAFLLFCYIFLVGSLAFALVLLKTLQCVDGVSFEAESQTTNQSDRPIEVLNSNQM